MHHIRKIDRGRILPKRDSITFGREHDYLILEKIDFQRLNELPSISALPLPGQDLLEPIDLVLKLLVPGSTFVAPMGGDALLRDMMHLKSADLDLHRRAFITIHLNVKALIKVRFGTDDIVIETCPYRTQCACTGIA